jgi:hypothetical protein
MDNILIEPTEASLAKKPSKILPEQPSEPAVKKPALKVEFLPECVRMDLGQGLTKLVEYEDFYNTFTEYMGKLAKKPVGKERQFLLPKDVFYLAFSEKELKICCYYPGDVKFVTYITERVKRVTPNIILSFKLTPITGADNWQISSAKFFCTDLPLSQLRRTFHDVPNSSNRVYLLPFPNMYDGGGMCTGGNQLPREFLKAELRPLNAYYDMIFNSPFNNDLGVRGISNGMNPAEWMRLLASIAKEPTPQFPYKHVQGYTAPIVPQAGDSSTTITTNAVPGDVITTTTIPMPLPTGGFATVNTFVTMTPTNAL